MLVSYVVYVTQRGISQSLLLRVPFVSFDPGLVTMASSFPKYHDAVDLFKRVEVQLPLYIFLC
jgi:hypothetical protein